MSDSDDPQTIAEETSRRVQPDNPYVEPPNSTVDDWFGQRVQHDADVVDEILDQADGATNSEQ